MGHFVSFPEAEGPERVERLVLNLVDPAVDAGAVGQLISLSLSPLDGGAAALFNSDPLIDYRSQRPLMNYKDGRLVDMRRSGIVLSHASDVEGQPFLHLHGAEPDFQWDALLADMIDIIERFGVKSTFSFTAVPSATPHTRPADMVVRTADKREDQVFEADFWFTASFADYVEFHTAKLGISHTNVAVRVPVYLAGDRYFTGAAGALGLTSSLSGLYFPLGDLEQAAAEEVEAYSSAIEGNEELAQFIDKLEKDYDANGSVRGYVTAPKPELRVPTVDEIGRAAEQFLAGVSSPRASASEKTFDPQGLLRKMERYQGFLPGESGVGEGPAFDVSAMRGQPAGGEAEATERSAGAESEPPAGDEEEAKAAVEEAADVATDAAGGESPESAAEGVAAPAEDVAVAESEGADVVETAGAESLSAPEDGAGVAEDAETEGADVAEAVEPEGVSVAEDEEGIPEPAENEGAGIAEAAEAEAADGAGAEADVVGVAEPQNAEPSEVESEGEAGVAVGFESDETLAFVYEESQYGADVAAADNPAEGDVSAKADVPAEADDLGDRADVEADGVGEAESVAEAEEGEPGDVYGREVYDVGEADSRGEDDVLDDRAESYGQAESYAHVQAEEPAEAQGAAYTDGNVSVEEFAGLEDAHEFAGVQDAHESEDAEASTEFTGVEDARELAADEDAREATDVEGAGEAADDGEPGEVLDPNETLEPLSALGRIKAFLKTLPDVPDPSEQNGEPGEVLDPNETLEPLSAAEYIDVAAIERSGWKAPESDVQDFDENGVPVEDAEELGGDGLEAVDAADGGLDAVDAGPEDRAFESAAAETEGNADLLITESEVIESMMGDSADQSSGADGVSVESPAEPVHVVDAALADSAMAGPPSQAGSFEASEQPDALQPPVSFDSAGSFQSAGSFDLLEQPSAFGRPGSLAAGGEGASREFEGVSFTTGDGGQAVGYEGGASEEGLLPSDGEGAEADAWPVRGWDEALGFGSESDAVVPQGEANARQDIVFAPHVFGAALSAGDTPRHSALERMQTLVLKDSPEAEALAEASLEKAEQDAASETEQDAASKVDQDAPEEAAQELSPEAPKGDGDVLASGETALDVAGYAGQSPDSPGQGDASGPANDTAANGIGAAGDSGVAPAISATNQADPLGGIGADSKPPASPEPNVGQLPEPGQGQVRRRRGKHSA